MLSQPDKQHFQLSSNKHIDKASATPSDASTKANGEHSKH